MNDGLIYEVGWKTKNNTNSFHYIFWGSDIRCIATCVGWVFFVWGKKGVKVSFSHFSISPDGSSRLLISREGREVCRISRISRIPPSWRSWSYVCEKQRVVPTHPQMVIYQFSSLLFISNLLVLSRGRKLSLSLSLSS